MHVRACVAHGLVLDLVLIGLGALGLGLAAAEPSASTTGVVDRMPALPSLPVDMPMTGLTIRPPRRPSQLTNGSPSDHSG